MIIAAIKTNGNEKLLAIARRFENGKLSETKLCDWNTVPNTLRIFNSTGIEMSIGPLQSFKDACKIIFSLNKIES